MKKSTIITIAVIVVVLITLLGIARRRREAAVTPGATDTGTNTEETTGTTGTEPSNEATPSDDLTEIQVLETEINAFESELAE